ncbi:UNVERIFIED_CONTAM: hypothetical protein FKN15_023587 [Acipenser sinensis]
MSPPSTLGSASSQATPPVKITKTIQQRPLVLNPASQPSGARFSLINRHTASSGTELFCVCGALKRAKLVRAGFGEVVFVKQEDAVSAYRKYNNRCLDGQPMKCNLHMQGGSVITSDQPILL